MKARRIGDWTLEDRIAEAAHPVVVFFLRTGDARQEIPLEEFRHVASVQPSADFFEVDLVENPSLAAKYSVHTVPLTVIFVDGLEVARHAGSLLVGTVERILGPGGDDEED